jgi:hypothetical protein
MTYIIETNFEQHRQLKEKNERLSQKLVEVRRILNNIKYSPHEGDMRKLAHEALLIILQP